MKFNWKWLIVAIIIFAAITSSDTSYGKWTFALVMIGIILNFGDDSLINKLLPKKF